MYCDIKNTKYLERLTAQLGERNAKEYALGADGQNFRDWFGNGKTTKLENGTIAPFVNPVMQVINQDGKQLNLLERYRFEGVSDVNRFLTTQYTPGITKSSEANTYNISHDENRFINHKLVEELQRIYPGLISGSTNSMFVLNEKYAFPSPSNIEKSVQLIDEVRELVPKMQGIYKEIFQKDPEQGLYEVAQQANSSESERAGAVKTFGERAVEIAQQLFPETSPSISYSVFAKRAIPEGAVRANERNSYRRSLLTLMQKLENRFNIPFNIVYKPEEKANGWFRREKDGEMMVYINASKAQATTPFHEYLHPFVMVLRAENPSLFSALESEMKTNQRGLQIQEDVNQNPAYKNDGLDSRLEEAMVTYLGQLASENFNENKSVFNRFVNWFKGVLRKLNLISNEKGIDFKNLSLNTTLADISSMITDDIFVADLKAKMQFSKAVLKYQRTNRDTDITYAHIFDRIKDRVAILNATIRKRKQGDSFKEDIAALNEIIKNEDEITSINNFVANSLNYVDSAYNRFNSMRDAVKDPSKLSKEDISYNLYQLGEIQQLLNVFDSMSDIQLLYMREGASTKNDNMARLSEAIAKKDIMISDYKNFALTYLTEWLYPYVEPTNRQLEATGHAKDVLTKEQFRDQMIMATRDIDASGYYLGAVINSQDPISAAIGLALKDVIYDNHVKDLQTGEHLQDAYHEVKSTSLFTTSANEEQFNMQFLREADNYEQVGVDENGEKVYGYVKRLAYHTEYLDDQYEKARRTFFQDLGPKPSRKDRKAYARYQKEVGKFYAQNTQINPKASDIIQQKKNELSKRQFERWLLENTIEMDNDHYPGGQSKADYFKGKIYSFNQKTDKFRIYGGDLIRPSEKYRNTEFNQMMSNKYYKSLYGAYDGANEKLGNYGLRFGIIPQESKGKNLFTDLKWSTDTIKKNLLTIAKAPIKSMYANYDSNRTVQRQDGTEVKHIPIKYTKLLDREDQKIDLLSSTMKFSQMANNYEGMAEVEPNILVLKTILNGDYNLGIKGRAIAQTNAKGLQKINAITKKIVPKLAQEGMLNARLNEFIDDVVFGDNEFQAEVNILGKDFSVNKIADNVGMYTVVTNMALNFTGGINNAIVGNYNNILEAMGGRFWGKKDYGWATGKYWSLVPECIGDMVGQTDSILNHMAEYYDIPQGEFKNEYGQDVAKGTINKAFRKSSLMFLQKGGEHQIQLTGMLALMHNTKITTKDGKEIHLVEAWEQKDAEGETISPVDNPNLNWTKADDTAFRNRLHAINKNLHGVYNKFDKSVLQRRWYGKLALMFRKYMFTAFRSRYGRRYVDYELGTVNEGYWNTFVQKIAEDIKDFKFGMLQRMWTKEGYDDIQKNAMNRTLLEFGVILSAMLLAGFANKDDDKSWLKAEAALQLTRMSADITQFISPADFIRVIRNPAASINLVEKWIAVAQQLVHPTEQYQRASGIAKKGDNKLFIKLMKAMPGVRQIINTMTPAEQIKYYNLPGTK